MTQQKRFGRLELRVKNAIIEKLDERVCLFKTNATKMKAVLRIPRLTRHYHDLVRANALPEYDCLEQVYRDHFSEFAKDLV